MDRRNGFVPQAVIQQYQQQQAPIHQQPQMQFQQPQNLPVYQPHPLPMQQPQIRPQQQMQYQQPHPVQVQPQPQQYYRDTYGQFYDPLYYTMAASPVPMRMQLHGETFFQRVAKNIVLGFGERFFFDLGFMVRQMRWPTRPTEIEVNPTDVPDQHNR